MTTNSINLKVPFNEKDQAKALGARWNAELKLWYVPQGVEAAPFEKWFTNTPSSTQATHATKTTSQSTTTHTQATEDDMDSINAALRDAYELREVDEL